MCCPSRSCLGLCWHIYFLCTCSDSYCPFQIVYCIQFAEILRFTARLMRHLGANSFSIRLRACTPFLQPVLVLCYPFGGGWLVWSSPVVTGAILQQPALLLWARPSLYGVVGRGTALLFGRFTTYLGAVEIAVTCLHSSDTIAISTTVGWTVPL